MPDDLLFTRRQMLCRIAGLAAVAGASSGALGTLLDPITANAATRRMVGSTATTLFMSLAGDLDSMDPHTQTLYTFYDSVKTTVFNALVAIDQNSKFVPSLAASWDISPSFTQVTFHLRPGVKFHDGTPFDSSAVAFNIQRIQAKATASSFQPNVAAISKVLTPDANTVVFHLSSASPAILSNLLAVNFISPNSVGTISKIPVGTGPFKFKQWVPGDHITVVKNDDYFLPGVPKLDSITFKVVPDPQVALAALQTGAIQLVDQLSPENVAIASHFSNAQIIKSTPSLAFEQFNFNTRRPPFNNKIVRQAISYAFDRKSFVDTFWAGLAVPSTDPVNPTSPYYLPGANSLYTYDLAKTVQLLKQAGFTDKKPLTMQIIGPTGYPTLHDAAILLQSTLTGLGHKVTVEDLDLATWLDRIVTTSNFDITTNLYGERGPDPTGLFNANDYAPTNWLGFDPPGYAALLQKAASETNMSERIKLYQQIQTFVLEEMPTIVIDHTPELLAGSSAVSGFVIQPDNLYDFSHVSL